MDRPLDPNAVEEFNQNRHLFFTIRKTDSVTVYEGLPHQNSECELLAKEKREKATVQFREFACYQEPLVLSEKDQVEVRRLIVGENTFEPYWGEKKCGGF